jgi:hypothetical protein
MEPNMRGIGDLTKLVGKENSGMLTGIFLKENGLMTKQTVTEFTSIKMELDMKANGKTIFNTVKAKKFGLTTLCTKDFTMKVRNMAKGSTFGRTAQDTTVIGTKTE